ncbi:MAG: hypothetical protein M1820_000127 [Bogoriella megaspora]|nr:MAG: hypothetical protein M1820_000127 [Bogoriella megaspora]
MSLRQRYFLRSRSFPNQKDLVDAVLEAPTKSYLPTLPIELQHAIFDYVLPHSTLVNDGHSDIIYRVSTWTKGSVSLLSVSRLISENALAFMYGHSEFRIVIRSREPRDADEECDCDVANHWCNCVLDTQLSNIGLPGHYHECNGTGNCRYVATHNLRRIRKFDLAIVYDCDQDEPEDLRDRVQEFVDAIREGMNLQLVTVQFIFPNVRAISQKHEGVNVQEFMLAPFTELRGASSVAVYGDIDKDVARIAERKMMST